MRGESRTQRVAQLLELIAVGNVDGPDGNLDVANGCCGIDDVRDERLQFACLERCEFTLQLLDALEMLRDFVSRGQTLQVTIVDPLRNAPSSDRLDTSNATGDT